MKRREFVGALGSAAFGYAAAPSALAARGAEAAFQAWTWVHGGRERAAGEWRDRFARLREAGFRGVLVSGGATAPLAAAARDAGLEFDRWTWILNRNGDRWAIEHHPEWFTVSRKGESSLEKPPYVGYYKWVCPTRRPVREYLANLVSEVAREPGVDGVHLDYIRHCDVILPVGLWSRYNLVQDREYAEYDFCYCEVCREAFERESGTDPLALSDPPSDVAWRQFRWNSVTGLVGDLAAAVHGAGKRITAAVFPTPTLARRLVRQAWDRWPLDGVYPMLYHNFYNEDLPWIGRAVREGLAALPAGRPLHAGLYLPNLPPDDLARAVGIARDAGAAGVSLFEMDGLTEDHLTKLQGSLPG